VCALLEDHYIALGYEIHLIATFPLFENVIIHAVSLIDQQKSDLGQKAEVEDGEYLGILKHASVKMDNDLVFEVLVEHVKYFHLRQLILLFVFEHVLQVSTHLQA